MLQASHVARLAVKEPEGSPRRRGASREKSQSDPEQHAFEQLALCCFACL